MFFRRKEKKSNSKKAADLEAKGDRYLQRQNFKKALKAYRSASEVNPENPTLYEKLISTQAKLTHSWNEQDFLETMTWTMKKQEIENPELKGLYETLAPEYAQIKNLIGQMLLAPLESRKSLIEQIHHFGEKAVRPLIDTLLTLDSLARGVMPQNEEAASHLSSSEDPKKGDPS